MVKVLGCIGWGTKQAGGCEVYRVTQPLHYLGQQSDWATSWAPINALRSRKDFFDFDIYIFPRITVPHKDAIDNKHDKDSLILAERYGVTELGPVPMITVLKAMGKKTVYECDDDFTNIWRTVHGGGEDALQVARQCDAVTVSTPHLANLMQKFTGKPSYVVPNCIEPGLWADPGFERKIKGLTIGLSGSQTHDDDWRVLETVIPKILEKYPTTTFVLSGHHPSYFDDLPKDRVVRLGGVPYGTYPAVFRSFDIALAPVDPHDQFNLSKSGIKAIEAMAAQRKVGSKSGGACIIATRMNIYERVVIPGSTGLLVEHTPEAWEAAISQMVENKQKREKLQIRGHRWVKKNRSIHTNWKHWASTYKRILSQR
jgi:glycosyltransferase involved in cell wall biosynthesis